MAILSHFDNLVTEKRGRFSPVCVWELQLGTEGAKWVDDGIIRPRVLLGGRDSLVRRLHN